MFPQHDTEKSSAMKVGAPLLLEPPWASPFSEYDCSFVQQKGFQVFFSTTKPTTISQHHTWFCRVDSGSVDISHWNIQNLHSQVSKAWVDYNERFLHHNPCTQSSNVNFSDFRSNWSQNMRQKILGDWKSGKRDKEISHRWDGLHGLVVYVVATSLILMVNSHLMLSQCQMKIKVAS